MAAGQGRKSPLGWIVLILVLLLGVGAIVGAGYLRGNSKGGAGVVPFAVVSRGPLTISVNEPGTIRARQVEVLKSEVEGTATILYLIPEGRRVKKGDLLVELDASKLQDDVVSKQITVQNAEAAFIAAREALEVAKSQAKSDIAKAELDAQFAKEDLEKYVKGEYPKLLRESESKIALANEDMQRAQERLKWSKVLFEEQYLSATELQADMVAHSKAKLDKELAEGARSLLTDFTYKRQLAQLRSDVEQTEMALERVKRKAAADVVQADAALKAKQSEYERQKALLEKNQRTIEKAKIFAPTDGVVVYATTGGGGGFRRDNEPLAEGQNVRERQEIIHLPTAASMMAEVKIHESSLSKVREGLPARVTVDAVPGVVFWGRVARIAPMPDSQSFWQNPDLKVYNTEIHLDVETEVLRTGMSCRGEVIIEQHTDVPYVPVQSVVRVDGKPTVYLLGEAGKPNEPRAIELGLDNNRMARIISGLSGGEKVLLNPPLSDSTKPEQNQQVKVPDNLAPASRPANRSADGGARAGPGSRPSSNLTPEEREARRKEFEKRMESMTPEERQKFQEQMRQGRGGRGSGGSGNGSGGGTPRSDGGGSN